MVKVIYRVVLGLVALFTMDSCVSDRTDEMRGVKEEVLLSLSRGEEMTTHFLIRRLCGRSRI